MSEFESDAIYLDTSGIARSRSAARRPDFVISYYLSAFAPPSVSAVHLGLGGSGIRWDLEHWSVVILRLTSRSSLVTCHFPLPLRPYLSDPIYMMANMKSQITNLEPEPINRAATVMERPSGSRDGHGASLCLRAPPCFAAPPPCRLPNRSPP